MRTERLVYPILGFAMILFMIGSPRALAGAGWPGGPATAADLARRGIQRPGSG